MTWDRRLLFEDAEGYLRIVVPCPEYRQPQEPEAMAIARLWAQVIPDSALFIVCRQADIPADHTFRDAWRLNDQNRPIRIDFDLALQIHRKRLYAAAELLMQELGHQRVEAVNRSDKASQVAIDRTCQILRTLHEANMSHCKTLEDIKEFVPKELKPYWSLVCKS